MEISSGIIDLLAFGVMDNSRRSPYEPSFSKIPARIIDPAIGASTCALGSQR